jgi:Skp family chaperone for outer membrane proteins
MSMKFDKMGWFVAVAMAGAMFGMGFKAPGDKVGTVDIMKVFRDSDYAKKENDNLHTMGSARQGIIDLVVQYPVMKTEDAQSFKDLTLKDKPTPDDKASLDRITQSAKDADSQYRALTTKSSPTPTELAALDEFNRRKDQNTKLVQNWRQEFENDISSLQDKLRADALSKVRDAVAQVAKDQGFSVVFVTDVAPYSANDITDAALKAMNKK